MSRIRRCRECQRVNDIRLSWSALRSHIECKQKGYLQRTGHKAKMENQRLFFPGTVTDRVVRDWLAEDPYNNPGLMPHMVEDIVNREQQTLEERGKQLRWRDSKDRDSIILECQEAVRKIEPSLEQFVLPHEYDVDFSFKAPMVAPVPNGETVNVILNGFMDIIVRTDAGEFAVYDVKHTKNNEYWRKTRGQLSFYDLAVDVMFEKETFEVGLLQPLCDQREKRFNLSDTDRTSLLTHVHTMVEDIYKENFEPTASTSECFHCNVKHACSKFKPVNGSTRVNLFGTIPTRKDMT